MNAPRIKFIRDKFIEVLRDDNDDDGEVDKRIESGRPFEGYEFLDIGCGGGLLSEVIDIVML